MRNNDTPKPTTTYDTAWVANRILELSNSDAAPLLFEMLNKLLGEDKIEHSLKPKDHGDVLVRIIKKFSKTTMLSRCLWCQVLIIRLQQKEPWKHATMEVKQGQMTVTV
mgnify:CR=1 FL=1